MGLVARGLFFPYVGVADSVVMSFFFHAVV